MKKSIVIALSVVILLIITVGVVGLGSKKADCSKIEDSQLKKRCNLFKLLSSYGLVTDYDKFMSQNPYEKPKEMYFTNTFRDEAVDLDGDGKFDLVRIYVGLNTTEPGDYEVESIIFDDKNMPIDYFKGTQKLKQGFNEFIVNVSSQKIYEKRVFGYLKLEHVSLFKGGKQLEIIAPKYETTTYRYDDFSALLPDLVIKKAEIKDGKLQVVVENIGKKHAFNVAVDLKVDNNFVFGQQNSNRVNLMKSGDKHEFSIDIPSAKEFIVVVDPTNFVDESNETNNEMLIVK